MVSQLHSLWPSVSCRATNLKITKQIRPISTWISTANDQLSRLVVSVESSRKSWFGNHKRFFLLHISIMGPHENRWATWVAPLEDDMTWEARSQGLTLARSTARGERDNSLHFSGRWRDHSDIYVTLRAFVGYWKPTVIDLFLKKKSKREQSNEIKSRNSGVVKKKCHVEVPYLQAALLAILHATFFYIFKVAIKHTQKPIGYISKQAHTKMYFNRKAILSQ